MATLAQLIERVRHRLGGNTTTASASLTGPVGATAQSLPLDDTTGFSRGVVEVGFELMRVANVDPTSNVLNVPAWGRGYKGTSPAAHPAGAEVRFNPSWPNAVVADEINGVIRSLYPSLYAVKVHETTFPDGVRRTVDVPDEAIGIVSIWAQDARRDDEWTQVHQWSFNRDSSDVGRPLRLGGAWRTGEPVRVVYAVRPSEFGREPAEEFTDATGLPERIEELVVLGAAARLTPFLDVVRLQNLPAENRHDPQSSPAGQATVTGRMLRQEFELALERETAALHREHPIKVHRGVM